MTFEFSFLTSTKYNSTFAVNFDGASIGRVCDLHSLRSVR
jgi:hypothetical protein